jgi:hypothetical protein
VFPQPLLPEIFTKNSQVARGWNDPYCLVAIDDNHPFPHGYDKNAAYDSATNTYLTEDDGSGRFDGLSDAIQGLMDEGSTNIWCVKTQLFTPDSVLSSVGYNGLYRTTKVMSLNGMISGFDCINTRAYYFNWNSIYGPFANRFTNFQQQKAAQGEDYRLWVYECGKGPDYTYCNHLIENTGLQSELLFWQTMQNGATGYLYYGANLWNDHPDTCGADGSSIAYDGSAVSGKWQVNRWIPTGTDPSNYPYAPTEAHGTYGYGNGVLLYGSSIKSYLRISNSKTPLGTVRIEHVRDGIEDYEMLYKYGEIYGESAKQEFIEQVSNNVVDYLSMPSFDRSGYSSSMTNEDIFAQIRIELGNAVEANGADHTHEWDAGVETKAPTYTETGIKTYTCTICGETMTEEIPVLDPLLGDVNGDGKVTVKDVSLLKRFVAGLVTEDDIILVNSDLNGDGKQNAKDITAIKKFIALGHY